MTLVRVVPVAALMVSSTGSIDEVMPTDFYVATADAPYFAAIFLIFVGFLPAAKGDVRKFGTCSFYKQEAVACCVIGELLLGIQRVIACLHLQAGGPITAVLRFFVASQAGNAGLPGSDTMRTVLLPQGVSDGGPTLRADRVPGRIYR